MGVVMCGYGLGSMGAGLYGKGLIFCRYIVTGFINKNKDPIYQDFMRLLYNRCVT